MARKSNSYRLSRLAEADLENIYAYTVEGWSIDQANQYIGELRAAILGLAAGTKIGHRLEGMTGYFSLLVGSHNIICRETGMIVIARILHKMMDAPRHLQP